MQSKKMSMLETFAQNFFGILIAFFVLMFFGVPVATSLKIQFILFFLAFARGFLIRRFFVWIDKKWN